MSDERLRELERRWHESGDLNDRLALVLEQVRSGRRAADDVAASTEWWDAAAQVVQVIHFKDDQQPLFVLLSQFDRPTNAAVVLPWEQTLKEEQGAQQVRIDLHAGRGVLPDGTGFAIPPGTTWIQCGPDGARCADPVWGRPSPSYLATVQEEVRLLAFVGSGRNADFRHTEPCAPRLLQQLFPQVAHDCLRRVIRGETATRVVDVEDGVGKRLAAVLDRGRVALLIVAPVEHGFVFMNYGRGHCYSRDTDADQSTHLIPGDDTRCTRLDVWEPRHSPDLPALDALWEAVERIQAGATVEETVRPLVPAMWEE